MSLPGACSALESFVHDPTRVYEPSIASSASSSQASIFSDSSPVQSSIASSISDDFHFNQEDARDRTCAEAHIQQHIANAQSSAPEYQVREVSCLETVFVPPPSYASVASNVAEPQQWRQPQQQQHKHPRRRSIPRNQRLPQLVRQEDRKIFFVDTLVDSATQMVEVIWPLSVVPCRSDGGSGRGVLPLRTYVEETLKRSRTSYSTLQVALYYLILIKPFVPERDFTMEQKKDCPTNRSLMCGRRMFLAALILASKYLQDRNYSAKAWSKMSGLKINEINSNEMIFLNKVNWKLHIPEPLFRKWVDIVLRYTPNAQPPSPGSDSLSGLPTWRYIIPLLTPELDKIPLPATRCPAAVSYGTNSFASKIPIPVTRCPAAVSYGTHSFASPLRTPTPSNPALRAMASESSSQEGTPTPTTVLPRFLEPKPDVAPPTPALARLGPLPTPQMTPSSVASSTPAASACESRRPSMCSAMSTAQRSGLSLCTLDPFTFGASNQERRSLGARRPSAMSVALSASSPESMVSDRSTSSRASSVSSVSTVPRFLSSAPTSATLARQATCQNARLPIPFVTKQEDGQDGSPYKPILIVDDDVHMTTSPEPADFAVRSKVAQTPHRHSKHSIHHAAASASDKGRKRCRSRGNRRSELYEEVRLQLEEELTVYDEIREDELIASPSPAAERATRMLSQEHTTTTSKQIQPSAALSRRESYRMPLQKNEGKKRTCCSTSAMAGLE